MKEKKIINAIQYTLFSQVYLGTAEHHYRVQYFICTPRARVTLKMSK